MTFYLGGTEKYPMGEIPIAAFLYGNEKFISAGGKRD